MNSCHSQVENCVSSCCKSVSMCISESVLCPIWISSCGDPIAICRCGNRLDTLPSGRFYYKCRRMWSRDNERGCRRRSRKILFALSALLVTRFFWDFMGNKFPPTHSSTTLDTWVAIALHQVLCVWFRKDFVNLCLLAKFYFVQFSSVNESTKPLITFGS